MATVHTKDFIEGLQRYLISSGKSKLTIKSYLTDLRMFLLEYKRSDIDLANFEYNAAIWLNNHKGELAAKTTLRRLTTMRNVGLAFGMDILESYKPPVAGEQRPHPLPGGRADLEKLLSVTTLEWQRTLVALTGFCGLRVSEARAIGPDHFIWSKKALKFMGKGHKEREVVCSDRAWKILNYPALEAKIEGYPTLITCSDRTARYTITNLGKRAGIERAISSHDLRATFATEAYRKTRDIRAVQILLGHSTVAQTQLYILSTAEEQRDAASFADDPFDDPFSDLDL